MKKQASSNLTLKFASMEERAEFIAWYLDGGGEQYAHFYTDLNKSDWTTKVDPYLTILPREESDDE